MVLLGDFLDPEELEFALAMVIAVAHEVQARVERQDSARTEETSARITTSGREG